MNKDKILKLLSVIGYNFNPKINLDNLTEQGKCDIFILTNQIESKIYELESVLFNSGVNK